MRLVAAIGHGSCNGAVKASEFWASKQFPGNLGVLINTGATILELRERKTVSGWLECRRVVLELRKGFWGIRTYKSQAVVGNGVAVKDNL